MFSGEGGSAESRIATVGLIDLDNKRAGGFGVGKLPVLFASATEIRFGSSALDADGPQRIEGSFDRASGEMSIVVRSQRRPAETVIRMALSCRLAAPVS
jgi:hypothetical protein